MATDSPRMAASARRELILAAAVEVFGTYGYVGATTDQVARAAGISQPYVVRMFGSKEQLFIEVAVRAKDSLIEAFRTVIATHRASGAPREALTEMLGGAYMDLTAQRGVHLVLSQAFLLGHDPAIGTKAREGFLEVWSVLTEEADLNVQEACSFLGIGMLINVLLGTRMPLLAGIDPRADALIAVTCGPKTDLLLAADVD